jgi:uncharacterized membrane protein YsdA (DUF1294 family)
MEAANEPESKARIAEWDRQKGYGFLQFGRQRLFLHRRDFVEHHKRPAVGDIIRFTVGRDAQGRICARNAAHVNDGGRLTALGLLVLAGLLVLPGLAMQHRRWDVRWVAAYGLGVSLITYWAYAVDKRRAREQAWRVSEGKLHLLALAGGWPGGFLAQRRLRHKCSKGSFQFVFWLIVLAWQFAAADSFQNWEYSKIMLNYVEQVTEHRR